MAGVVFVFVREDASEVETLAEALDDAGHAITGSDNAELCVVVWSRRALRSEAFRAAADNAFRAGRTIVAALFAPPTREDVFGAPVVDLSQWDGVEPLGLDPLFLAADDMLHPVKVKVIALPSRPVFEDAQFCEAPLMITSGAPKKGAARQAWEAPIPSKMLRPVCDEPASSPKVGAPAPRHDFRRINRRKPDAREHAALAFAVIAMLGGGAFVASLVAKPMSLHAEGAKTEMSSGVSLTSAQAEAVGLEDSVLEAPGQIGHRGVEPPSAHRAAYDPRS